MTREAAIQRAESLVLEDGIPRFVYHDLRHPDEYWIVRREMIEAAGIDEQQIVWRTDRATEEGRNTL